MISYEVSIMELLKGDTPRQKYENLKNILQVAQDLCYPGRGTEAENWNIFNVADKMQEFIINPNE